MSEAAAEEFAVQIPVEWEIPDEVTTHYANHMVCQAGEHETTIAFFQSFLQPLFGTPAERKAKLEKLENFKPKCLVRIVVSKSRLKAFAKAIQTMADAHGTDEPEEEES